MNSVFLDTVGLLAVWDVADQWHAAAEAAYFRVIAQRSPIITTSFVLLECGNAAARRPYRSRVAVLRQRLQDRGELIMPTDEDWDLGWNAYTRGVPVPAGIVDHVSFVVMRRLGISHAFTNDRHFSMAGFETLF